MNRPKTVDPKRARSRTPRQHQKCRREPGKPISGTTDIDGVLEAARSRFERVEAADLYNELAAGALLIDIRPVEQRLRDGELPGAIVIDRNVLEWRLAPGSSAREVDVKDHQRVIIVCNEGYQSSLAAAMLIDLGVRGTTDLIGGYQALLAAQKKQKWGQTKIKMGTDHV